MFEALKKYGKAIGIGVATLAATTVEIAGSISAMNKIVEDCDEDNPANFIQTLGVCAVAIGATAVETVTVCGGMYLIEQELEQIY